MGSSSTFMVYTHRFAVYNNRPFYRLIIVLIASAWAFEYSITQFPEPILNPTSEPRQSPVRGT